MATMAMVKATKCLMTTATMWWATKKEIARAARAMTMATKRAMAMAARVMVMATKTAKAADREGNCNGGKSDGDGNKEG
jgi:hypothetical protein